MYGSQWRRSLPATCSLQKLYCMQHTIGMAVHLSLEYFCKRLKLKICEIRDVKDLQKFGAKQHVNIVSVLNYEGEPNSMHL